MSADYDPAHPPANPIGSCKASSARGLTWNISQWQFARSRNRHPQEVDVPEPDVSPVTVPPTLNTMLVRLAYQRLRRCQHCQGYRTRRGGTACSKGLQ